jgi:hypothetical protein
VDDRRRGLVDALGMQLVDALGAQHGVFFHHRQAGHDASRFVKLGKHDHYPHTDERVIGRGASKWFKTNVRKLHDRGVEVYSNPAIEHVVVKKGKARKVRHDDPNPAQQKVWIVGRIPYERIAYMDWEPDPAYGAPRFYVATHT